MWVLVAIRQIRHSFGRSSESSLFGGAFGWVFRGPSLSLPTPLVQGLLHWYGAPSLSLPTTGFWELGTYALVTFFLIGIPTWSLFYLFAFLRLSIFRALSIYKG